MTPDQALADALDIAERLRDRVSALADRVQNVARLHRADPRIGGDCRECFQPWPCRSVGALLGALPETEYPR